MRPVTGYTSGAGSISVNVSGPRMLITADTAPSGSVSLWCVPQLSGFAQSAQLTTDPPPAPSRFQTTGNPGNVACTVENKNVTDAVADCDLSKYVGKEVGFDVQIDGRYSALYTIGFR